MKGFMCQSVEATAICTMADPRSVVVPRRPDKTLVENTRLLRDGGRYNRLAESSSRYGSKQFGHTHAAGNTTFKRSSTLLVPYIGRELEVMKMKKNPSSSSAPLPIKQLPLNSPTTDNVFRVVVMRVSLHCQGCAGKVKKHISKMEGVTSYSIDLEMKRVTVMGHVSPEGVLESISKVKRAEFWPSCSNY